MKSVAGSQEIEGPALLSEEKAEISELERSQQEDGQIQFELGSEDEDMGGTGIDHRVKHDLPKENITAGAGYMDTSRMC